MLIQSLLVVVALLFAALAVDGTGIIGQACSSDADCIPPRQCKEFLFNPCSSTSASCQCYSNIACTTNAQCAPGEQCIGLCFATFDFNTRPSTASVTATPNTTTISTTAPTPTTPVATSTSSSSGTALTSEQCSTSGDCRAPRQCLTVQNNVALPCAPEFAGNCICFTIQLCQSDAQCVDGEVCRQLNGTSICLSETVVKGTDLDTGTTTSTTTSTTNTDSDTDTSTSSTPSSGSSGSTTLADLIGISATSEKPQSQDEDNSQSDTGDQQGQDEDNSGDPRPVDIVDNEVCIAVHSLSNLPKSRLLYPHPRRARVLCDPNNTCATPGHIISYHSVPLMMKTYCERYAKCTSTVMYVNSPVYQPGFSLPSNTHAVRFTTHAARFQSRTEELFLSTLVRLGL